MKRWQPKESELPAFFQGRKFWLTPSGQWIDCNSGNGHLRPILQYHRDRNLPTIGDWEYTFYNLGYVRVNLFNGVLHTEFFGPLSHKQQQVLKDYAVENGCENIWFDNADKELSLL